MAQNAESTKRPKIAVLANTYKYHLHTQHIIDRILDGYGFGGVFRHSPLDVDRETRRGRSEEHRRADRIEDGDQRRREEHNRVELHRLTIPRSRS